MIDDIIEMALTLDVHRRSALYEVHIGVIEVVMDYALVILGNRPECSSGHTGLVVFRTEACIQVVNDALGSFVGVLDLVDFARGVQVGALPHGERLVDHHVLSSGTVEFGGTTQRDEVIAQVFAGPVPLGLDSDPVNP